MKDNTNVLKLNLSASLRTVSQAVLTGEVPTSTTQSLWLPVDQAEIHKGLRFGP